MDVVAVLRCDDVIIRHASLCISIKEVLWLAIQAELTQTTIPYGRIGLVTLLFKNGILLQGKPQFLPNIVVLELGEIWLSVPFQDNETSSSVSD